MDNPNSPEDLLSQMFGYTGLGKTENMNKMLITLIRNTRINMLRQVRHQIDANIKELTSESAEDMEYDKNLDPYKILGVKQTATREEIDRAFKNKAKTAHPDAGGSTEDMIRVNAAYESIRQFRGWK